MDITIEQVGIDEVSPEILAELKDLYAHAYHNGRMYEDLVEDIESRPEVLRLFPVRLRDTTRKLVGARVVGSKADPSLDYHGFPPMHGKRFCILPDYRGRGIGKRLIDEGKRYCFEELDLSVLFGQSNEAGALSLYGREGALYLLDSIKHYSRNNKPSQNIEHFKEFITNQKFRDYRLPIGDGVYFVYCKDEPTAQLFREYGYVSSDELLGKEGRKSDAGQQRA